MLQLSQSYCSLPHARQEQTLDKIELTSRGRNCCQLFHTRFRARCWTRDISAIATCISCRSPYRSACEQHDRRVQRQIIWRARELSRSTAKVSKAQKAWMVVNDNEGYFQNYALDSRRPTIVTAYPVFRSRLLKVPLRDRLPWINEGD